MTPHGIDIVISSHYDAPIHGGSLPMRGDDQHAGHLFSYLSPDDRIRSDDPDAHLYKRAAGQEAKPAYLEHVLTENRHG